MGELNLPAGYSFDAESGALTFDGTVVGTVSGGVFVIDGLQYTLGLSNLPHTVEGSTQEDLVQAVNAVMVVGSS